ncbi:MAG: uracil-DNA glycosylase [Planctomycetota bacterium]
MKRQSIARALVRQLQARLELEAGLGGLHVPVRLPAPTDLTRVLDPDDEAEAAAVAGGTPADRSAPAAPTPPRSMTRPAWREAAATSRAPASGGVPTPPAATELGRAAGVGDEAITDLPAATDKAAALAPVREAALACTRCGLCESRRNVVFGEGSLDADLVFVGEAPGADEDRQGHPFVGRAGELLTAMIEKGMNRSRDSVYICNILKCRPPGNRDPEPAEVAACAEYLREQLRIIRPRLIIALGRIAGQILSGERMSMKNLRGRFLDYRGIPLLPIYHPAYLLRVRRREGRGSRADRETWQDLQNAMAHLERTDDS